MSSSETVDGGEVEVIDILQLRDDFDHQLQSTRTRLRLV